RAFGTGLRLADGAPAMCALAGNLDHLGARPKAGLAGSARQRRADRVRGRLADGTAALADQEHHHAAGAVVVAAGDEGVAALDAVREALLEQEVERPIDGDRRRAPTALVLEALDQLIGADRLMSAGQGLQDLSPDRRKLGAPLAAERIGPLQHRLGAMRMVMT